MTDFDPRRYAITVRPITGGDGEYHEARVADLPDLIEYAESPDRAYSLALESIGSLHEAAQEQGRPFPAPGDRVI